MSPVSISSRIKFSLLAIAVVFLFIGALFMTAHIYVVTKYERISRNISLQYELIDRTSSLVQRYNVYRNAPIERTFKEYQDEKAGIEAIFAVLETTIINEDSQTAFIGVKNTIASVIKETDHGLEEILEGDIEHASEHYVEANRRLEYVRDNTSALVLKEVQYSAVLQKEAVRTDKALLTFSAVLFVFMIVVSTMVSKAGAQQIVGPLIRLTALAKKIAEGNLEINADKDLLLRKDELGSLSQSLDVMIHNLRDNLHILQKTNAEMVEAKTAVDQKNKDLERFNKLMVDRELKMVELKKRITELEGKNS